MYISSRIPAASTPVKINDLGFLGSGIPAFYRVMVASLLILAAGCGSSPEPEAQEEPKESSNKVAKHNPSTSQKQMQEEPAGCKPLKNEQTLLFGRVKVDVKVPNGPVRGDMLILPGWNFSRNDWCQQSTLCHRALRDGYRIVMPEMGKSIYSSSFFPESRKDWQKYPTRTWLTDTLIPTLQQDYCLFEMGNKNFVLGLSTGGRGVVLVCLHTGTLFTAGAALSGDYDQTLMAGDNLMRGVYGDYATFPERWEGMDNPAMQAAKFRTPLYLGHGKKDDVVPYTQTEHFYEQLAKQNPKLEVMLNLAEEMGHDYDYWNGEVGNMLGFFSEFHKATAEAPVQEPN